MKRIPLILFFILSFVACDYKGSTDFGNEKQEEWLNWYRDRMATDTHLIAEFNRQLRNPNLEDHEKISILWELYENTAKNWHDSYPK